MSLGEERRQGVRATPDQVRAEVERILLAASDYLAAGPMDLDRALACAQMDASGRFIDRGSGAGAEPFATLIAGWVARRADMRTPEESLTAAVRAVRASDEGELARDLRAFIDGYFDGSLSNQTFLRCLNDPRRPISVATRRRSRLVAGPGQSQAPDLIPVSAAARALRRMLSDAGLTLDRLDPAPTWRTFLAFAALPLEGIGQNESDDQCLFECGVHDRPDGKGPRFNWGFCRRFTLYDADGGYDHSEQLHCELHFEPTPQLAGLREDGLWSGSNLTEWAAAVEARAGFQAVLGMVPLESRVEQSRV
jgi:hypothetical protein